MAGNNGYETLQADLKSGVPHRAYIFHGIEEYLRTAKLEELRAMLVPAGFEEFNYHRLGGKGLTVESVSEVAEAMPMMAEHTLLVVEDWDIFRLDENGRNSLVAWLSDIPEYCTVVFLYDTMEYKPDRKMKKLCGALDEYVVEVEFTEQERGPLLKWLRRRFADLGHTIDDDTADHLMFTCGSLMHRLVPEIEKIAAYAAAEPVTAADVDAVAEPILEAVVFDMTKAVTAGDYDAAAQKLSELLRMQEDPIPILAALGRELQKLYTARMALDGGKDRFWLQKLWKMKSDYPAKLMMQAAKRADHQWYSDALQRCQKLDRLMKSGNIDREQELKMFLMELAGGAR